MGAQVSKIEDTVHELYKKTWPQAWCAFLLSPIDRSIDPCLAFQVLGSNVSCLRRCCWLRRIRFRPVETHSLIDQRVLPTLTRRCG